MTGVQLLSRMLTLFVLLGLVLVARNCIYYLIGQSCARLLFSKRANKITALIVYEYRVFLTTSACLIIVINPGK